MQSGIAVSPELHDAFNAFTADPSLFCLPVTITSESLTPLSPIPFSSSSSSEPKDAFYPSLPQLSSLLKPQTPIYLILRRSSGALAALTYIPSNAGVRNKTLFASTRATLVRELGSEKFASTIFATEEEEVVGEEAWRERDAEENGGGKNGKFKREDLMDEKERELEAVKRAEEEARSGTLGRDVGIGGTFIKAGAEGRIPMPVDEDAKAALRDLQQGGLVQLAIDVPTETIKLAASESSIAPSDVASKISDSSPRYTFYHYPDSDVVIFIYTCPSKSSIKERMLYASTRRVAILVGENEGIKVSKKIEGSSPDEITEARLREEVYPPQDDGSKRGFARPKRPGR
ncbi:putative actin monomer binding protein [Thermoascus aurantiacus ATCC 26904]